MIRLFTLPGTTLLGSEGETVRSVLDQPRRLALLTYLALSTRKGPPQRETLLALFWPEHEPERARHALNQALHYLRQSLGRETIESFGAGNVGIGEGRLWCDARAFEDRVATGDLAGALELYQGDLLLGFNIDGAPGFERWLDDERERLRALAASAAEMLAEMEEQRGDLAAALPWARRALELSPYDEKALRRLITLSDRAGERTAALQTADLFRRRLWTDLESEPSAETLRLVESIRVGERGGSGATSGSEEQRRRGAGAAARGEGAGAEREVTGATRGGAGGADPEPAPGSVPDREPASTLAPGGTAVSPPPQSPSLATPTLASPPPAPSAESGRKRVAGRFRVLAYAGWVLCALLVIGAIVLKMRTPAPPSFTGDRPRIAIFPFDDLSSSGNLNYLAAALTTAVAEQLAHSEVLQVISGRDLAPALVTGGAGAKGERRLADAADLSVRAGVLKSEGRIRVRFTLTEAATGTILRTAEVERPDAETFSLIDDLSTALSSALRVQLGREMRLRRLQPRAEDARAWELLIRASRQQEEAGRLEESGALASAAGTLQGADSLLATAESLAPRWPEPVLFRARIAEALGWLYFRPPLRESGRFLEFWRKGIEHAGRVIERDPEYVAGWELRGLLRHQVALLREPVDSVNKGLLVSAEKDLRRAVEINPSAARAWNVLSRIYLLQGNFTDAKLATQRAYDTDAYLDNTQEILSRLVVTSLELSEGAEAERWCSEIRKRYPRSWTGAHCRLSIMAFSESGLRGHPGEIQAVIDSVEIAPEISHVIRPQLELLTAAVFAKYGQRDSAEAVMRRINAMGSGDPELLYAEAIGRTMLGQYSEAKHLLASYFAQRPLARSQFEASRFFRPLYGRSEKE